MKTSVQTSGYHQLHARKLTLLLDAILTEDVKEVHRLTEPGSHITKHDMILDKPIAFHVCTAARYKQQRSRHGRADVQNFNKMLEVLLANRFDPNMEDSTGLSLVEHAAMELQPTMVRILIEHGAEMPTDKRLGAIVALSIMNFDPRSEGFMESCTRLRSIVSMLEKPGMVKKLAVQRAHTEWSWGRRLQELNQHRDYGRFQ